jgi:hypothetical protein
VAFIGPAPGWHDLFFDVRTLGETEPSLVVSIEFADAGGSLAIEKIAVGRFKNWQIAILDRSRPEAAYHPLTA